MINAILIAIHLVVCVVLIGLILLHSGKDAGMASSSGFSFAVAGERHGEEPDAVHGHHRHPVLHHDVPRSRGGWPSWRRRRPLRRSQRASEGRTARLDSEVRRCGYRQRHESGRRDRVAEQAPGGASVKQQRRSVVKICANSAECSAWSRSGGVSASVLVVCGLAWSWPPVATTGRRGGTTGGGTAEGRRHLQLPARRRAGRHGLRSTARESRARRSSTRSSRAS